MFQKRILKHGAMARAQPNRGTAIFTVWRMAVFLPKAPVMMVP